MSRPKSDQNKSDFPIEIFKRPQTSHPPRIEKYNKRRETKTKEKVMGENMRTRMRMRMGRR